MESGQNREKDCKFRPKCIWPALFLFVAGVCLWLRPMAYTKEYIGGFAYVEYSFLQAGDYYLEIAYSEMPTGSKLLIYTPNAVDEKNQQGVVLKEINLECQEGMVGLNFCLEQDTWSIYIAGDAREDGNVLEGGSLDRVLLQSVQLLDKDNYFLGGCLILLAVFVFFCSQNLFAGKYRVPFLLVLVGMGACIPLLNDSLKWGHDIHFHLMRIEGIYQGLKSGVFPVRVNPVQLEGFGYLSATMYPQLFLYPAAMLRFLGVSLGLCYKMLLLGASVGTALLTYYSVRGITKSDKAALLAAVLYTLAPYRLIDMYTRAALGELLAMTFLPLAAWGLYEVLWGNQKKWILLALGVSGVIQCHLLSTEMYLLFMVITALFWLFTGRKNDWAGRIGYGFLAVLMVLLWNMGLWLPILFYSREGMQAYAIQNNLSRSAVCFSQMFTLFAEPTGPNKALGYTQGEMPLSVGLLAPLCSILLLAVSANKGKREHTSAEKVGLYCLFLGGIALLLSSDWFPWAALQKIEWLNGMIAPIEFVWRFLGPASFLLCTAGAVGLVAFGTHFRENFRWSGYLGFGAMVVLLCSTVYYFDRYSWSAEDLGDKMLIAGVDEKDVSYLYDDSDSEFSRRDAVIRCSNDSEAVYSGYRKDGTSLSVTVVPKRVEEGAKLLFPLYGYTGYEVLVNGEPVKWERIDSRVTCDLPTEESLIEICYKGPRIFVAGDIIAWTAIVGSAVYGVIKVKKSRMKKQV